MPDRPAPAGVPENGTHGRDETWIVVVNFGAHGLIEHNFAGLTAGGGKAVRLVVVDNFSSSNERTAMAAVCSRQGWTLVSMRDNAGFGAACNEGVRVAQAAGARGVILVNPDAVLSPSVADALTRQVRDEPLTLVAPTIVDSTGASYFQGSRVDLRSGRMRGRQWSDQPVGKVYLVSDLPWRDWLTGACLAFSVDLWDRAGGLDERYFLYWEDVDFSQRCVAAGARLCLRRDLVAVHDEGGTHGTQGSRARSRIYYYYNCRNRLLYAGMHLPRRELLRWLLKTPSESWQILLRGGRRQLLHSPAPLLAVLAGSLAGTLHAAQALLTQRRSR